MIWWITLINAVMLLFAHLYTMLSYPVALKPLSMLYSYVPDNVLCAMVVLFYSIYTGQFISYEQLVEAIYKGRSKSTTDFNLNLFNFIFWQIIIVLCVGF